MADRQSWTLLTTHGAVWVLVAREGAITAQHLAERLGIAVRSAQRVLADLEEAGYVVKHKEGRRNRYEVLLDKPMRHRGLRTLPIGDVLGAFLTSRRRASKPSPPDPTAERG